MLLHRDDVLDNTTRICRLFPRSLSSHSLLLQGPYVLAWVKWPLISGITPCQPSASERTRARLGDQSVTDLLASGGFNWALKTQGLCEKKTMISGQEHKLNPLCVCVCVCVCVSLKSNASAFHKKQSNCYIPTFHSSNCCDTMWSVSKSLFVLLTLLPLNSHPFGLVVAVFAHHACMLSHSVVSSSLQLHAL